MSLSLILIDQIITLFIIIIIGVICYKTGLINDEANKRLSDILLYVVTPAVIFTSYQRDFSKELMEGLIFSLIFATLVHVAGILISYILIRKKKKKTVLENGNRTKTYVVNENYDVERFAAEYANVGFMGIPLINGIYGSEGVFYVTAYITLFNLFVWTHGVIFMSGSKNMKFKDTAKMLLSPSIISIIIGLICFALQIKVPKVVYDAFNHMASLNTPLAMLIIGVTIAKTNIAKILVRNIRMYYINFIKLILVPLVIMAIVIKLPVNDMLKVIAVIMGASPIATTVILFSIKYDKNSVYAAETLTLSMLLCVVTIPLVVRIAEMLL